MRGTFIKRSLLCSAIAAMLLCGCMDAQQAPREEKVTVGTHKAAENTKKQQGGDSAPEEAFNIPKTAAYVTNNMSEEQKRQLCKVIAGITDFEENIDIDGTVIGRSDVNDFISIVLSQMPYIDYIGQEYTISVDQNEQITSLSLNYTKTKEQAEAEKAVLDQKLDEICAEVNDGWSDYKKVLFFHDKIIDTCHYSETGLSPHSAYGCLVDGQAVCEGYAKAMQLLCARTDIECICVSGFAADETGPQPHIWNKILVDGVWANFDVTWDDPLTMTGSPYRRYDFFGLTDDEIGDSHVEDSNRFAVYPDCDSDELNYYRRTGFYYDGTASAYDVMSYAVLSSMSDGDYAARIKCSDAEHYTQAIDELFEDHTGTGAAIYGIIYDAVSQTGSGWATNEYAFAKNDSFYTLTVFFR